MNKFAYQTTRYAIKALSNLSKARVTTYGEKNIPEGAIIFAVNHFTRIETFLVPYHINRITNLTLWSLADYSLFEGSMGAFLNNVGALSTRNPDRDLLIVKSLLTGEAAWIIFPEGRMVKNKKIYEKKWKSARFVIESPTGKHLPHTGTATLALRTEFYRRRIHKMLKANPGEARRIADLYQIEDIRTVLDKETYVVPVNLTYYPIRARENIFNRLAEMFFGELSDRLTEEVMTEGTMLLSGVDVDIRFGEPIRISQYMKSKLIQFDIESTDTINFDDPIGSRRMMRLSAQKIMQRYMSAIYNMTTVNHDHLFATLMRYLPKDEIEESDFRRRAFLAATLDLSKMAFFRHRSLDQNQIHLLTDDRFEKVKNFIMLAIEKKALTRKGNMLIRHIDSDRSVDFHRIRLDNPVSVIANEIEPLHELQQHLKRLAWQPDVRIRYWVAKYLQDKALFDFDKSYSNFYIKGESKDRLVGRPFMIKGNDRETGILLIHGYMAAPLEVRALAHFLANIGYTIYVPRLRGHGTSPDDLAECRYTDWISSVEEGYAVIRNTCKRIVVGGFSTGAGLALDLCTRVTDVSAVFAISPPLKLQHFSTRFVPAVHLWNRIMRKLSIEATKKEFVVNTPENPHINYHRNPISGLVELERLMDALEAKLPAITVPAVVIQGFGDPVVDPAGSRAVFERLGSLDKEYLMIRSDRHGIINGEKAWRVFQAVALFLERVFQP